MDHYAVAYEFPDEITLQYSHCVYTPAGFGGLHQTFYGSDARGAKLPSRGLRVTPARLGTASPRVPQLPGRPLQLPCPTATRKASHQRRHRDPHLAHRELRIFPPEAPGELSPGRGGSRPSESGGVSSPGTSAPRSDPAPVLLSRPRSNAPPATARTPRARAPSAGSGAGRYSRSTSPRPGPTRSAPRSGGRPSGAGRPRSWGRSGSTSPPTPSAPSRRP